MFVVSKENSKSVCFEVVDKGVKYLDMYFHSWRSYGARFFYWVMTKFGKYDVAHEADCDDVYWWRGGVGIVSYISNGECINSLKKICKLSHIRTKRWRADGRFFKYVCYIKCKFKKELKQIENISQLEVNGHCGFIHTFSNKDIFIFEKMIDKEVFNEYMNVLNIERITDKISG